MLRSKIARILLVAALAPGLPAVTGAAEHEPPPAMTVAQFTEWLASQHGLNDKKLAQAIAERRLTERLGTADRVRIEQEMPGPRARLALLALADASAFLAPPAALVLAPPAPDKAAQLAMLAKTVQYVEQMKPRLPNFSALRSTTSFEVTNAAQILRVRQGLQLMRTKHVKASFQNLGPAPDAASDKRLYWISSGSELVTYRNGGEVSDAAGRASTLGMSTTGEFGPVLAVVVGDAARGEIQWLRWELGSIGSLAVFRYKVPKEASHFAVGSRNTVWTGTTARDDYPAYHGEIAIDPADGAVYRLTMSADMDLDAGADEAEIMVEYAPVSIGGKDYVCPVHGVAISTAPEILIGADVPKDRFLNDVAFTDYHIFRSESRIVLDAPSQ